MENLNYEGIDLIGEDQLEESAENPVNTQLAKPAEQVSPRCYARLAPAGKRANVNKQGGAA